METEKKTAPITFSFVKLVELRNHFLRLWIEVQPDSLKEHLQEKIDTYFANTEIGRNTNLATVLYLGGEITTKNNTKFRIKTPFSERKPFNIQTVTRLLTFDNDIKYRYLRELKDFCIQGEDLYTTEAHFAEKHLKVLCNIVGITIENLYWQEESQNEESNNNSKMVIPFLEAIEAKVTDKNNSLEMKKYANTYRMLVIKNPFGLTQDNMISSKIVEIMPENNHYKIIETSPNGEVYSGIAFTVNNCLVCLSLDYDNTKKKLKDIQMMLLQTSIHDEKVVFFHGAELLCDYERNPTFRRIVFQKINSDNKEQYEPRLYKFNELHKLIDEEPEEARKSDLERILLHLMYEHLQGKAKFNVKFVPSTVDLFKNMDINLNESFNFADNLTTVLGFLENNKVFEQLQKMLKPASISENYWAATKKHAIKKADEIEKYIGTYQLYAISNPQNFERYEIISKILTIRKDVNGYIEFIEKSMIDTYAGQVRKMANNLVFEGTEFDNETEVFKTNLKDQFSMFVNIGEYDDKNRFFKGLELCVNYQNEPTSRIIILEKLNDEMILQAEPTSYFFEHIETVIDERVKKIKNLTYELTLRS